MQVTKRQYLHLFGTVTELRRHFYPQIYAPTSLYFYPSKKSKWSARITFSPNCLTNGWRCRKGEAPGWTGWFLRLWAVMFAVTKMK